MNIVRHLKNSNSPSLPKKPFRFGLKLDSVSAVIFGVVVATYLDLFFVRIGMYRFPLRPFPEMFLINVLFTFIVLPVSLFIYLSFITRIKGWNRTGVIFALSLLAAMFEKLAEKFGWFSHHVHWHHFYTLIGYFIYLHIMMMVYLGMKKIMH